MKIAQPLALALSAVFFSAVVIAESHTFQAISDFDDVNAGEVPFYQDTSRGVLAIDAAVVDYRDKFARAETVFTGAAGIYDVTITTLGEIDGEGEYRFLVDGAVVGSAVNELVETDWGEQLHVFDDISIPAGAVIAVEANARSNGLIPENGEFAFARGRWKTLHLEFDTVATSIDGSVDLSLAASAEPLPVVVGDAVTVSATVTNLHPQTVATNIQLSATLTDNLQFVSGDGCSATGLLVNCQLPAVAPGENSDLDLQLATLDSGAGVVVFTVLSPQIDTNSENNATTANIAVLPAVLPAGNGDGQSGEQIDTSAVLQAGNEISQTVSGSSAGSSGGGGSPGLWMLCLLGAYRRLR